ncbi:radical SAM protein [Microbacterium sp. NPDC019599]|uniref:radical SAM protein n=1 Tax=Microbacterium sp. NPDC019599 TaxID=3154690 RepID=UPI003400B504
MTEDGIEALLTDEHGEPRYVSRYLLLKLAQRCNIACTYCYWFRDPSVYEKPALLTEEAETALLARLGQHVDRFQLKSFFILLHGGEPTLIGKDRFRRLVSSLREVEESHGFELKLAITTNGILVDREWAEMFARFSVGVTLSIDGPEAVHDARRIDHRGRGTYKKVISAITTLREAGVEPGILAVCDPERSPDEMLDLFVDDLNVGFDILVPDANHDDAPPSIAAYYMRLFDRWYDRYASEKVRIRFIDSIVKGLLGYPSESESIGYGPVTTTTMLTDGSLEPLDVLRATRTNITKTDLNIQTNSLQDIQTDPVWREILYASLNLAAVCRSCPFELSCGGGHVASRWSSKNRFDNPSVYCDDFKAILGHAWERMRPDLFVQTEQQLIPLMEA